MRTSALCMAVLTYVAVGHPPSAAAQVDQQRAQEYFKEAQALCERDGGRLWSVSLCAPLVIADQRTHTLPPANRRRTHLGLGCSDSSTRRSSGVGRRGCRSTGISSLALHHRVAAGSSLSTRCSTVCSQVWA